MPTAPPTTQPQRLGLFTAGLLLPGLAYAHGAEIVVISSVLLIFAICLIPAADLVRRTAWRQLLTYVVGLPFVWAAGAAVAYLLGALLQWLLWGVNLVGLLSVEQRASLEPSAALLAAGCGLLSVVVLPFIYWRWLLRPDRVKQVAAKSARR